MILQSVADFKSLPRRIVSLVPSLTELLYFLGLEGETIAITKFCVHPVQWQSEKIIIGGTKNIHVDQVKGLHPDLIIANKEENVKEQVRELAELYPVWLTDVSDLTEALQMIKTIGLLTGKKGKAEILAAEIASGFSQLEVKMAPVPSAYLVWRNPLMTVGGDTFINDMLGRCGLQNIFAGQTRYPEINISELKERGCKILLLSSEPYPFRQRHLEELQQVLPGTKILLVDGEIFSWYGSRLLKAPAYFRTLYTKINAATK